MQASRTAESRDVTMMPEAINTLLELADVAARRAYAPYSRLQVGAAVESVAGGRYAGCNVENAAYPCGGCAEQHAIAAAVCAEGPTLRLRAVAISAFDAHGQAMAIPPCGACRQRIIELGPDARVAYRGADGAVQQFSIDELLPHRFVLSATDRP